MFIYLCPPIDQALRIPNPMARVKNLMHDSAVHSHCSGPGSGLHVYFAALS
jgi:hypothetical protein